MKRKLDMAIIWALVIIWAQGVKDRACSGVTASGDTELAPRPAADYHAVACAVGGCPIYVSDKPGNHNFDLLRKLVHPDGSVLRSRLPGRPTRDCLFSDPARDGTSLLKTWNMNKCSDVVGVFSCQGPGWCRIEKKTRIHDTGPGTLLNASVQVIDVDSIAEVVGPD